LKPVAAGASLIDVTQGAGPLFDARVVDIAQAGSYQVVLSDLGFPANFADLALAVTRDTTSVGLIFGGGTFSFDAVPGRYFLNFIASPNAVAKAGTYGLLVAPAPPAPVVTLTATPVSVASGATTSLTWSATNATSCAASGAWTGTKATSGTETSSALAADSTFTLNCTGPGGSGSQSVSVRIAVMSGGGGGGGGTVEWPTLMILCAALWLRAQRMERAAGKHRRAASRR
jgi:hypothetical protein